MKRKTKLYLSITALLSLGMATTFLPHAHADSNQNMQFDQRPLIKTASNQKLSNAYDISQWQGYLNNNQAHQLRNEVNFMILRAQAGDFKDSEIDHNEALMNRNHIPYGVYSYSYYTSPYNAELEARELYQRSPRANFYANDIEQNSAGNSLDQATYDWAQEIHRLTRKPAVLYSGNYFLNHNFSPRTVHAYNAVWDAAYSGRPSKYNYALYMPYHYDLWQDRDNFRSPALGQPVDADVFPSTNVKPLSFWTGHYYRRHIKYHTLRPHYSHTTKSHHYYRHTYVRPRPKPRKIRIVPRKVTFSKTDPTLPVANNHAVYITAPVTNQVLNFGQSLVNHLRNRYNIHRRTANYYYHELTHLLTQVSAIRNLNRRVGYNRYYNQKHLNELTSALTKDARNIDTTNQWQNRNFNDYYRYRNIHHVIVLKPIGIYSFYSGHRLSTAYRHTHLYISSFRDLLLKRGWIVQSVGYYHGHKVFFTSNKTCIQWL